MNTKLKTVLLGATALGATLWYNDIIFPQKLTSQEAAEVLEEVAHGKDLYVMCGDKEVVAKNIVAKDSKLSMVLFDENEKIDKLDLKFGSGFPKVENPNMEIKYNICDAIRNCSSDVCKKFNEK